jgi:hypothetical protein
MARILGCGRSRSSRWAGRREPASAARRHETFLAGRRDVGSPSVPAAPDRRHVHLRVVELRHPIPLAVATARQARHRPVVSSLPPVPSEAARHKSRITRQGWLTWSAAGRAPGGPDRRDHFEVLEPALVAAAAPEPQPRTAPRTRAVSGGAFRASWGTPLGGRIG